MMKKNKKFIHIYIFFSFFCLHKPVWIRSYFLFVQGCGTACEHQHCPPKSCLYLTQSLQVVYLQIIETEHHSCEYKNKF